MCIRDSATPGEKIRISGGGRCNFTNVDGDRVERYACSVPRFVRHALRAYPPRRFVELVRGHGIGFHEKHRGQLFCDDVRVRVREAREHFVERVRERYGLDQGESVRVGVECGQLGRGVAGPRVVEAQQIGVGTRRRPAQIAADDEHVGHGERNVRARQFALADGRPVRSRQAGTRAGVGSVSGGCVEDDMIERVRKSGHPDKPALVTYGVTREEAARFGLPCGGTLRLVQEPVLSFDWIEALLARTASQELVARTLDLETGAVSLAPATRDEALAFCQAPPTDGGSGALLVLLRGA